MCIYYLCMYSDIYTHSYKLSNSMEHLYFVTTKYFKLCESSLYSVDTLIELYFGLQFLRESKDNPPNVTQEIGS